MTATRPPTSLPFAHLFVPVPGASPPPSPFPLTPITITTCNDPLYESLAQALDDFDDTHDPSHNIHILNTPPARPPRSPRRTPPKRLDANLERAADTKPPYDHRTSLSLSSLEYVRTALRTFRATLPHQRFPDKSPIRSPSRKYHRACSHPPADAPHHGPPSENFHMSSERRKSHLKMAELRAKLTGQPYERYGPAKPVRRDGVGGHWRSYSTPPPSTVPGGLNHADDSDGEGMEATRGTMSEEYDAPTPLRPRGGLPDFYEDVHEPQSNRRSSAPPPTLHIIHPSISTTPDDPSIYPPRRESIHALHHTHGNVVEAEDASANFAAVVDLMDAGQASRRADTEQEHEGVDDAVYITRRPVQGRSQTMRRNRVGPGGIISKIASKSSLSKLKIAFTAPFQQPDHHLHPDRDSRVPPRQPSPSPAANTNSVATYVSHRPAPPPPLLLNVTPNRFASSSSRVPSPSPTATPIHSRAPTPLSIKEYASAGGLTNGGSPAKSSVWGREEGLIEIPRFKKRELNLGIVGGGLGQRVAWGALWAYWIGSGLSSLFFDVNVIYMLVQCAQYPSMNPASASAQTWIFAVAAYAICWGISVLGVWMGWGLCFEFWRRWRMPRPAMEPLHTSLPGTLNLSLISFRHFTFFLYVRMSPLRTPHAKDIIPETAHLVVQSLPSLAPMLPRASLAIVLLVAFSGADMTRSVRDAAFWNTDTGRLTDYSNGVLLAFTIITATHILLILLSAVALWVFSRPRRPSPSRFRSRFDSFSTSSPIETRPATPTRARDPADTQSPAKGWMAESDMKWEWRERGRNRLQDAFELCMIRRPRSSAGPSSAHRSTANGWQGSPSRQGGQSLSLGPLAMRNRDVEDKENIEDIETILSPTSADPFMRLDPSRSRSTIRFAPPPPSLLREEADESARPTVQARPESEIEPILQTPAQCSRAPVGAFRQDSMASLGPPSGLGTMAAARQSASSQDLFYTPMNGSPATTEILADPSSRSTTHGDGLSPSPSPTPPSSYRRPPAPGPGPSTAGASLATLHALGGGMDRPEGMGASSGWSAEDEITEGTTDDAGEGVFSPTPDTRASTETTAESLNDDSTALLSRSSSRSDRTLHASHSFHTRISPLPRTLSLRRASEVFRARSQSLVLQFRASSGSLSMISSGEGRARSDQGHGESGLPQGLYTTLMERKKRGWDGDVSEFGVNPAGEKLGRNRATSVGVLSESRRRGHSGG